MMRAIHNNISDRAWAQLDELARRFESQRVALEMVIEVGYKAFVGKETRMEGFYASGGNGSYVELEDGRYADTVIGETSEPEEAHEALNRLCEMPDIDWISKDDWQKWSNWDNDVMDIDDHVAVDKP
jgi:hypothetical protein